MFKLSKIKNKITILNQTIVCFFDMYDFLQIYSLATKYIVH